MVPVDLGGASGRGFQVFWTEIAGLCLSLIVLMMTNFCSVSLWAVFIALIKFSFLALVFDTFLSVKVCHMSAKYGCFQMLNSWDCMVIGLD